MQLHISKTKEGKWDPEKAEKAFKFLKENMNGMELAALSTKLIQEGFFSMQTIEAFQDQAKKQA